jgi:hypothetical protein
MKAGSSRQLAENLVIVVTMFLIFFSYFLKKYFINFPSHLFIYWCWGLNSGPCTCFLSFFFCDVGNGTQGIVLDCTTELTPQLPLFFFVGYWDLNSGLHTC